jgi:hypothetical protein
MKNNNNILHGFLLAISLGVSCQANAQNQSGNNTNNCLEQTKGKGDSTCLSGLTYTSSTPPTKNFQASSIKPFSKQGLSCTTPWGQIIQDNTEIAAYKTPTGTYNYVTGAYAADCMEEQRHCTNGVLSGTYQYKTCTITPVDATCGVANGAYYTYPTSGPSSTDECNPSYTYGGVAPVDESPPSVPATSGAYLNTTTNIYTWTCSGEAGGSSASCFAYRRINAQCGSSINSCNLGNLGSSSSYDVYYSYSCNCTSSWTKAGNPSIPYSATDPNNSTYSSNGYTLTSSCSTCSAYDYTVYNWTCNGINGGTNSNCSVNQ